MALWGLTSGGAGGRGVKSRPPPRSEGYRHDTGEVDKTCQHLRREGEERGSREGEERGGGERGRRGEGEGKERKRLDREMDPRDVF